MEVAAAIIKKALLVCLGLGVMGLTVCIGVFNYAGNPSQTVVDRVRISLHSDVDAIVNGRLTGLASVKWKSVGASYVDGGVIVRDLVGAAILRIGGAEVPLAQDSIVECKCTWEDSGKVIRGLVLGTQLATPQGSAHREVLVLVYFPDAWLSESGRSGILRAEVVISGPSESNMKTIVVFAHGVGWKL